MLDVDEPPVFSKLMYTFTVVEESMVSNIGAVTATDPDRAKKSIRYDTVKNLCKEPSQPCEAPKPTCCSLCLGTPS